MLGKLVKGLLSSGTTKTPQTQGGANVVQPQQSDPPFAVLNKSQRGLGDIALSYIDTGEHEEVLPQIKAVADNLRQTIFGPQRTAIEQLVWQFGGRPEALWRYAQVVRSLDLTVVVPSTNLPHRAHVSDPVVHFLDWIVNARTRKLDDQSTKVADFLCAIERLGGNAADLVSYSIPIARGHRQRRLEMDVNTIGWEVLPVTAFSEALSKCDAKTRTLALRDFKNMPQIKDPSFLSFIFVQFEEGAKGVRDAARELLQLHDKEATHKKAVELLGSKKASAREAAVQVFGWLGTEQALSVLETHKETEKSTSVLTAIEVFVRAPAAVETEVADGYIDVFGDHIKPPEYPPLIDDESKPAGDDFMARMRAFEAQADEEEAARYKSRVEGWEKHGKKNSPPEKPKPQRFSKAWQTVLNTTASEAAKDGYPRVPYLPYRQAEKLTPVVDTVIAQMPLARVLALACCEASALSSILSHPYQPFCIATKEAVLDGRIGVRQVLDSARAAALVAGHGSDQRSGEEDDYERRFLISQLPNRNNYWSRHSEMVPGVWEIAAGHLDMLISALPPLGSDVHQAVGALKMIGDFPTLPRALVQPLLFCAVDPKPRLRKPAQSMLRDVPGLDEQLIAMLSDKRQDVRANAASFLSERGAKDALPALVKRLKTEKSEKARAQMISALATLGGDTSHYLGKAALLKEAEAFVAKLPNDKIGWLSLEQAPRLIWADGTPADMVLADGWLRLAVKLKSPMGTPLFNLYLSQMTPESAIGFCDWVLLSWVGYDIHQPSEAEMKQAAHEKAKQTIASPNNWLVQQGWTQEQLEQMYLGTMRGDYLNSGSDSKGILALTHMATPTSAAQKIASYLKNHGRRVAQAKSLVETLFGMGTPEAVQVLVATANRFKQRSVRELAETLVADIAEARGWSEDELADRSIPTGGFEEDGVMQLEVGEQGKIYTARLADDLSVQLFNPDGKPVKAIPAGKDAGTKESKALLSAAKKTIKTVTAQQQARLYDAMISSRTWPIQGWQDDLGTHPIMQRLIERVIWRGLDAEGTLVTTFRPTSEGEFLNADGDDVDLTTIERVDLAHTANLEEADRDAWLTHLKDFEVAPLFPQVSRPVRTLSEDQEKSARLDDREGWMMTTFRLRGAAKKAGYDRGPAEDGGSFSTYKKEFRGAGLTAYLHFSGSYAGGEEDVACALHHMAFTTGDQYRGAVRLSKVPPLLLSEVWNDMHEIAKVGAYDEDWQKKTYY